MPTITICVGSSCHVRGAHRVAQTISELISREASGARVELKGSFCLGRCRDGVAVELDGRPLPRVAPEEAAAFYTQYIRPEIMSYERNQD